MIGRDRELEQLSAALERAAGERPTAVLITGDAGVGKTTLMRAALERAEHRGFATLVGAAAPGVRGLAFAPLRAALRAVPERYPTEELEAVLRSRPGVAALLPGAAVPTSPEPPRPGGPAAAHEPAELYVEVLGFLGELAERRPVVLALEDLHWADYSTLEMLDFVARNLAGEPLVLLLTVRTDEPEADDYVMRTLAELARVQGVESMALGGLTRAALGELVADVRGTPPDAATVDALFGRVEGNPFYATELLHAGASSSSGLPPSVRDALRVRLAQLGDRHRQLLRAAAVVGQGVEADLLAAFLHLPPEDVAIACRAALEAGVLVDDPVDGQVRFRHALLQEQAYSELMAGERRRLHDRLAEHLAAEPRTPPAVLAYHYDRAGRLTDALSHTLRAARTAAGAHGTLDGVQHYRRAMELWREAPDARTTTGRDLVDVLEEASACALNVAVAAQAAPFLEALLEELDPGREAERWAMTAAQLSELRWESGEPEEAVRLLDRAEQLLRRGAPSPAMVRLLERRSYTAISTGRFDDATRDAAEAVQAATALGDTALQAVALGRLGLAHVTVGHPDGLEELRESLRVARRLGPGHEPSRQAINLLVVLHAASDMVEAGPIARELLDAIDDVAIGPDDRAVITAVGVRIATAGGELDRAADHLAAVVVPTTLRYREYLALADAEHAVASGDVERARARIDSIARSDALLPALHRSLIDAELAIRTGRPLIARRIVDDNLDRAEAYPEVTLLRLCGLALEALEPQDPAADGYLARAERKHESLGQYPAISKTALAGLLDTVRSLHDVVQRRPPGRAAGSAASALDQAGLGLLAGWARLHHARGLVDTGGDRTMAAHLVANGHGWAAAAGAVPLRSAFEDLVRRARLDVGGVSRLADGDLGLTEREIVVLRLVAAGRTNREVAERLYISPKTASVHVSNILRKVGATNRGEAAAVAHRHGLMDATGT